MVHVHRGTPIRPDTILIGIHHRLDRGELGSGRQDETADTIVYRTNRAGLIRPSQAGYKPTEKEAILSVLSAREWIVWVGSVRFIMGCRDVARHIRLIIIPKGHTPRTPPPHRHKPLFAVFTDRPDVRPGH